MTIEVASDHVIDKLILTRNMQKVGAKAGVLYTN